MNLKEYSSKLRQLADLIDELFVNEIFIDEARYEISYGKTLLMLKTLKRSGIKKGFNYNGKH